MVKPRTLSTTKSVCLSDVVFFFQAEDGIRDVAVTGVQTCALPISVSGVWVKAVHTAVSIALRVVWYDRSQSPDTAWLGHVGRVLAVLDPDEGTQEIGRGACRGKG